MDISLFLAVLIAVVLYVVMNRTTFGYELKACGFNKNASKYAGMNEQRNIILSMAIADGLAACGAAGTVRVRPKPRAELLEHIRQAERADRRK